MDFLDVPGARLAYELRGRGPLLLMIPGANGSAGAFRMAAGHLAARYAVLTYDRRGFSRSRLTEPQDFDRRLEADADDVRRLIEHISDKPAIVFGSSSGGIVALTLLTRRPSVVQTLVPHEPPLMRLLPDGQAWIDFFVRLYDVYRQFGAEPALAEFRAHTFPTSEQRIMAQARSRPNAAAASANAAYGFEHELRQYPAVDLDLAALQTHAGRIVPAVGRESHGYACHAATVALGERLGRDVLELPGGHIGCVAHPAAFADALHAALAVVADTPASAPSATAEEN